MRNSFLYCILIILSACAKIPIRQTANTYTKNRKAIERIVQQYDVLYSKQPFIFGFTDGSFKYVSVEVNTDTMRYVFNTAIHQFAMADTLRFYHIDTMALKQMAKDMLALKCRWIGRSVYYVQEQPYVADYLSFGKSANTGVFKEKEYHVVGIIKSGSLRAWMNTRPDTSKVIALNDSVFIARSNKFK